MRKIYFLVAFLSIVAGCQQTTPTKTEEPQPPAAFEDPLPRWTNFFKDRFGKEPGPALAGDFNGDGVTDIATQVDSQIFIFHDTTVAEPKNWEVIDAEKGVAVEIKPASFAMEQIPSLQGQLSEKQSVFVAGEKSPVITFWYPKESAYAWQQVVPKELESARADAEKRLKTSFGITKNNLYGDKGFYGEQHLGEQFVGDFDGDGVEEFLAVEAGETSDSQFYLYKAGSTEPVIQKVAYRGTKAWLHRNPNSETVNVPFESEDFKPGPVKTKGAYVELPIPEKSGVFVVFDKKWKLLWMSD